MNLKNARLVVENTEYTAFRTDSGTYMAFPNFKGALSAFNGSCLYIWKRDGQWSVLK